MAKALVMALLLLGIGCATTLAQGVAPGGPIGGSTGIGSGLGGVTGTGPSYPNGTPAGPTLSAPIPPGGYPPGGHIGSAPGVYSSAPSVRSTSHYPQPQEPFGAPLPATPVLKLPPDATADVAFIEGCWHTDLFRYGAAITSGVTTYCFDDKGAGRLLYRRVGAPEYFCRGPAQARYEGSLLHITNTDTACTDGDRSYPEAFDCVKAADGAAQCSGKSSSAGGKEAWTVHLHWVGSHHKTSPAAER
jgi:hypothetical protein